MIVDLRRSHESTELETDLCVIGGGAAGIAIALEFLDAGAEVIVLESGGLRFGRQAERFNDGDTVGIDRRSLTSGRARGLGGATSLWAGQCLPADPEALSERPWVPHSGWPFPLAELEPFYRRAEKVLQIQGCHYDETVWDEFGVERPSFDTSRLAHRFSVWCPRPHLGRLYRRALSDSPNVRVLLDATVTELVTTPGGQRFDSVLAAAPGASSVRVRARACVICTGAIENARLLLASTGANRDGIGNRHGLVGRFFSDHPNGHSAAILGGDVARLQELYGLFYRERVRYLPRLVLSAQAQRAERVLSCAAHPVFHFGEDSGVEAARRVYRSARSGRRPETWPQDLRLIARDLPRVAAITRRRFTAGRSAGLRPIAVTLQTHAEQAPNPDSRVTLGRRRDALGVPVPAVSWRLTELDRRTASAMVATVADEFSRRGLGEVRPAPWLTESIWREHLHDSIHQMGTTRLGEAPEASVVSPDCEIHDVSGLFVAGASVFPAAGYVNPTLTIMALAIRLADHLKRVLGSP